MISSMLLSSVPIVGHNIDSEIPISPFGLIDHTQNFCFISSILFAVNKSKPAAAKGQYIRSCVTASTMGPGVKINALKQA